REATLNPTNPANKAVDWEADIVNAFRNGTVKSPLFGERDTPNGRMLFLAKPLKVGAAGCLRCHDTAEVAPPTMIAKYGSAGGFGWKLGEISWLAMALSRMRRSLVQAIKMLEA